MSERLPFSIIEIETNHVTIQDSSTGQIKELCKHQSVGKWTLMSIVKRGDNQLLAVFENLKERNGPILYMNRRGVILHLKKTLESTVVPLNSCYGGRTVEEIANSDKDILGEEVLSKEQDPSYEAVAPYLPPLRYNTFVGTPDCVEKPVIFYGGFTTCFRPDFLSPNFPDRRKIISGELALQEGLVGGWLPIIRIKFPNVNNETWEEVVFAEVNPPSRWIQPVWFRFIKLDNDGELKETHYFRSYLPYPPRGEPKAEEFYRELLKVHEYWSKILSPSAKINVPEERVSDLCLHSLIRGIITRIGDHPKYGVWEGGKGYGGSEHDGFPDTFTSSVTCYLEWGLFEYAKRYLNNYLSEFVREDGSIEYRGPEIGQYGRMLATIAKYYYYTKDYKMLLKHERKISGIVDLLLSLRKEALKLPLEDPSYGMIRGWCEADSWMFKDPYSYNLPYYSNSTEACRGFYDLGRAWIEIGKEISRKELVEKGEELIREAGALKKDILLSIERSILYNFDPPHLPGVAGAKEPYDITRKSEPWTKVGIINGRCYCEMLYSGILPKWMVEMIIRYQRKHNGTILGIPAGGGEMHGFTAVGYGYGLLQHDLIREFLLYYALMAHMYTRGTFTAQEYTNVDRSSQNFGPYCVPSQLTIPILTKWMLVFEEPDTPTVWLAKGVPRFWLEDGKTVSIENAPTKWGRISFKLYSEIRKNKKISGFVEVPETGYDATICIRLRTPTTARIKSIKVNGKNWGEFDPEKKTIYLPAGLQGRVAFEAYY